MRSVIVTVIGLLALTGVAWADVSLTVSTLTVKAVVQSAPGLDTADWIGLYSIGAPDSAYLTWFRLNGTKADPKKALTSGSAVFTLPATGGPFEVRFFTGHGYAGKLASAPVVQPCPVCPPPPVVIPCPVCPVPPTPGTAGVFDEVQGDDGSWSGTVTVRQQAGSDGLALTVPTPIASMTSGIVLHAAGPGALSMTTYTPPQGGSLWVKITAVPDVGHALVSLTGDPSCVDGVGFTTLLAGPVVTCTGTFQ